MLGIFNTTNPKKLFGTDGIRGVADQFPLDRKTVVAIASSLTRQFAHTLGRAPKFLTGRDTRESGLRLEAAFHAGVRSAGALCESAGVITTPGVALLTGQFEFDAGVVISASHNPFQDNGIKIFLPSGRKVGDDVERSIEADVSLSKIDEVQDPRNEILSNRVAEFSAAYLEYLASSFSDLDLSRLKIVVDCANGAASHLAPRLLERLGANVTAIHAAPDGRNINDDCGSLHPEHLQAVVVSACADLGVAFDGDADRALFTDSKGKIVDGDATLWILAQFLKEHGRLASNKVIATVMSNIGLELALSSLGIEMVRAAVGDKFVLDELISTGSELGGEQSGHIILREKSLVGDGMMTMMFVLEAMYEHRATLSQLVEGFTRFPQVIVNIKVREKVPFESIPAIEAESRKIESELAGNGRLLLRYSGTENLARVMIEGRDQSEVEEQANRLADAIRTSLG